MPSHTNEAVPVSPSNGPRCFDGTRYFAAESVSEETVNTAVASSIPGKMWPARDRIFAFDPRPSGNCIAANNDSYHGSFVRR